MKKATVAVFLLLSVLMAFGRNVTDQEIALALKRALRARDNLSDNAEVQVSSALATGKDICIEYRASTATGQSVSGLAVYRTEDELVFLDNSWIWERACLSGKYGQRRNGKDMTRALNASLSAPAKAAPTVVAAAGAVAAPAKPAAEPTPQPIAASAPPQPIARARPATTVAAAPLLPAPLLPAPPVPTPPVAVAVASVPSATVQKAPVVVAAAAPAPPAPVEVAVPVPVPPPVPAAASAPVVTATAAPTPTVAAATVQAPTIVAATPASLIPPTAVIVMPKPAPTVAAAVPAPAPPAVIPGQPVAVASMPPAQEPPAVAVVAQPEPIAQVSGMSAMNRSVSAEAPLHGVTIIDNNGALGDSTATASAANVQQESLADAARRVRRRN